MTTYKDIRITIFTPTYNRKDLLKRTFDSLNNQTDNRFIWLIVDDGSQDGTNKEVEKWKSQSKFHIEYFYQVNSGKHSAHNTGVSKVETDYILLLDSDDWLTINAIQILNDKIEIIDKYDYVSGIIGNRFDPFKGQIIGTEIPDIIFASGNELYQRYGFKGDTLRMYKTSILKTYTFPIYEGEKFIPENVIFDIIDKKYKMMVLKDVLYFCEYQDEGYSKNIYKIHNNSPKGYAISLRSSYKNATTVKYFFGYLMLYLIWCKKKNLINIFSLNERILYYIFYPIIIMFEKMKYPYFFWLHFK